MSRKFQQAGIVLIITALLFSCSDKKETPESIAAKWCELNGQVSKATGEAEKTKAVSARKEFEKSMESKYEKDTAMMQAIFRAAEACEAASEGRNNQTAASPVDSDPDLASILPMAYANAASVAKAFCTLVDQSVQAAQNNDAGLNKIVSVKVIFEKNMTESFQNDPERRDSIFKLIEPCVAKEMRLRSK